MRISEVFESIQGEGPWMGYPTLFVRLFGCNLSCSFCDTPGAKNGGSMDCSIEEMENIILSSSMRYVVFTGGEPCLQYYDLINVIRGIAGTGKKVAIETNGTKDVDLSELDAVVVSPKQTGITERWCGRKNVYMKFLASSADDIAGIKRLMNQFEFANTPYVMPYGVWPETIVENSKIIYDAIVSMDVDAILTPRLHILLGVK